jgi:osmotically-inducible protein OsmY
MKARYLNLSLSAATLLFGAATVVAYNSGPIPNTQNVQQSLRALAQNSATYSGDAFDDILITGKANFDDTIVTSKVKAAINADPLTSSLTIEIDTKDGMVVVAGTVPSAHIRTHLIELVATVEGVRNVKSNLRVAVTS